MRNIQSLFEKLGAKEVKLATKLFAKCGVYDLAKSRLSAAEIVMLESLIKTAKIKLIAGDYGDRYQAIFSDGGKQFKLFGNVYTEIHEGAKMENEVLRDSEELEDLSNIVFATYEDSAQIKITMFRLAKPVTEFSDDVLAKFTK